MVPYYPTGFEITVSLTMEQANNLNSALGKVLPDAKTGYSTPIKLPIIASDGILDVIVTKWYNWKIYHKERINKKKELAGKPVEHDFSVVLDGGLSPELIEDYSKLRHVLDTCNLSPKEYSILLCGGISVYKKQEEFTTRLVELVENGIPRHQALPAPK